MKKRGLSRRILSVRGQSRGGVLVEVAFVVFLLMLILVGMLSVAIQGGFLENQGRLPSELADHAKWVLEEQGAIEPDDVEVLERLALDRMDLPRDSVGALIHYVARHPVTGSYDILSTTVVGGLSFTSGLSVVNLPSPDPGVYALGQALDLDMGEEVVIVEAQTLFDPVPRGVGGVVERTTWAVAPLDPLP